MSKRNAGVARLLASRPRETTIAPFERFSFAQTHDSSGMAHVLEDAIGRW